MVLPGWEGMAITLSCPKILQGTHLTPVLPVPTARPWWELEDMEHSSFAPSPQCNPTADTEEHNKAGKGSWEHQGLSR